MGCSFYFLLLYIGSDNGEGMRTYVWLSGRGGEGCWFWEGGWSGCDVGGGCCEGGEDVFVLHFVEIRNWGQEML